MQYDTIIGPKQDMHWIPITKMYTSKNLIKKLQYKQFAAAWIVSNCTMMKHEPYVKELKQELHRFKHT